MQIIKTLFLSLAAAMAHVQNLFTTQQYRRDVLLSRKFTAAAGSSNYVELSLPKEGAFELMGWNIQHTLDGGAAPQLYLKFSNSGDGGAWSNDFLPIRCIATPGAPGVPRYGFMAFWRAISQEEKIKIEYNAANCANNIEIEIVFYGRVYAGSKVVGNKVIQ
ncbi:MAG: hypothetical protein M0Q24_11340 [Sulfurimonas sp.]|uniref:hypothetical protein n=1 Tax=Sulfurimonas sp. TaxID=2022749 RepID=UPI0025CF677A|nr:hypothetical protein [Sulfurimonas sp.]MCK9492666.1 hypothetical protein [Sulfurimonas sp.]